MHRAQQDIVCVGCTAKFTRAAALIAHIEAGRCVGISAEKYHEIRQKKDILKEAIEKSLAEKNKDDAPGALLLDIGGAMQNLAIDEKKDDEGSASSKAADDSSQSDMLHGGVSLKGALSSKNGSTRTRSKQPIDLITGGEDVIPSMSSMPVQAPQKQASSIPSMSPRPLTGEWAAKRSPTEQWPTWGSPASTSSESSRPALKGPWAKGAPASLQSNGNSTSWANAARQSTVPVKPTPQQRPQGSRTAATSTQGLASSDQQWDSSYSATPSANNALEQANPALAVLSGKWDPSKFWNDVVGQYVCACDKVFDSQQAFEDHIHSDEHNKGTFRCPGCLKLFKSITALVAHCESASVRCAISRSENFSKILSDISAGILDTDGFNPDGSVKYKAKEFDMDSVEW